MPCVPSDVSTVLFSRNILEIFFVYEPRCYTHNSFTYISQK